MTLTRAAWRIAAGLALAITWSALATPLDGLNTPTDRQAILFGRLNKTYGTRGKHPNGVYHGKVGYIIE